MPALPPYIPATDAGLDAWAENFTDLLTASPGTYGLIAGDASACQAAYNAWHPAYIAATSPGTRTSVTVQAKDDERVSMLATIRPYAQQISLNAGVLASDKVDIGVNPRTTTPTPITTPTTNPILSLVSATPLQHVLRYRDETASPSVKSKPYGVLQLQLFGSVSPTPITDPTLLKFIGVRTKSPSLVAWDAGDVGDQAYYAARWVTRTGLVGPWSPIVDFTVAG